MKKSQLTPINVPTPPRHTQIKPRCATCKKFPVCNLRSDYLKTAFLIQEILGDPQDDLELSCCDCTFKGYDLQDPENYLSEIVVIDPTSTEEQPSTLTGTIKAIKYKDESNLQALYDINRYLVVFNLTWSEEFSRFEFSEGHELYYNIVFNLANYDIDTSALVEWRNEMIAKEEENEQKDYINTTFFSAILNCDFYEYDKKLTEEEGWKRMELHWKKYPVLPPYGPYYYHLATYHIEPNKVPELDHKFSPLPLLYPVFIPKPPHPPCPVPPPQRREDLND